jgi:adenylosuccinate lyase
MDGTMIPRYTRDVMKDLWSEDAKFGTWLEVELAVCEAWMKRGKIPRDAMETIRQSAGFTVERIEEIEAEIRHDLISFLTCVAEHVGPDSRFVHMGLTSSDVVDTAQALRLVRSCDILLEDVDALIEALKKRAIEHRDTVMVGRTHGIHAEPTSFGLKMLLWHEEMKRNRKRLEAARETVRVGKLSGAVGNYAHIEPEIEEEVCAALDLVPAKVSTQVLQRDRLAELVSTIAIIGSSLDKFATDIRSHQRTDLGELREPFGEKQKGSSAMPHKRNPEICERISGLARILRGNAVAALENVPLWHERDISHSSAERVILPDSIIVLDYILDKMTWVILGLVVNRKQMWANLERTKGLVYSQRVLLTLVGKGLTREEAYAIVQRNAMKTWDGTNTFRENLLADPEFRDKLSKEELDDLFQPESYLKHVKKIYMRAGVTG